MEESSAIIQGLAKLAKEGEEISEYVGLTRWSHQVAAFLNTALSSEHASEFLRLESDDPWQGHALRMGHIQGLLAKLAAQPHEAPGAQESHTPVPELPSGKKVFVVHGHDGEAKEVLARFLEKLELEPIVLHEQPNSGRTIIEKFETYSGDTAFSVVLLTPDDVGAAKGREPSLQPRARQNVILELGYFLGRLGRRRVCALYKGGVELPSDVQGVLYVAMDDAGAWKAKLAQELIEAKLPINIKGLVGG